MDFVPSFQRGDRLGPYELIELIGRGGFGEVYRARDVRLEREVAVKTTRAALSPEDMRRLEVEAKATAALNHPNIIAIHDVGFDRHLAYVVTELLEGESLRAIVRRGALPMDQAVGYTAQILEALSAAHARGIVHRDLKPDNIFVLPGDRIKVLDFGLAKFVPGATPVMADLDTVSALTAPGHVLGTPAYLSPEQARGVPVDHRADLFAVGVVLYEMLVGVPPFRAATLAEAMSALLRDPAPPLPAGSGGAELARVVSRCLEKEPSQRFQSASDLRFALESVRVRPAVPRAAWPWVAAALVVLAVALAGWRWPIGPTDAPTAGPASSAEPVPERIVRQSVAVSRRVDHSLIGGLFTRDVSVKPVDATHLEVAAPANRLPEVISVIQMADVLAAHRFVDEPALTPSATGSRLFRGISQSKAIVSLTVRDVPVRRLLQVIAKSIGWPVVFDVSVKGNVTLSMQNVPWDLLVRSCMEFQGADLTASRINDVWLVSSRARAAEMNDRLEGWTTSARRVGAAELVPALEPARSESGLILHNTRLDKVVIVDKYEAYPDYARVLAAIDGVDVDRIDIPRPGNRYTGKRVSFDMNEVHLPDALRIFEEISGLNMVVEPAPAGTGPASEPLSGTLTEVRWDNAFGVVLMAASRLYVVSGRIVYVTPPGREMTDVVVETVTLTREDPAFFQPFSKFLTPRGALSIEPKTRTVVIRDVGHRVLSLRQWILAVDRLQ